MKYPFFAFLIFIFSFPAVQAQSGKIPFNFSIPEDPYFGNNTDNVIIDPQGKWVAVLYHDQLSMTKLALYNLSDGKLMDTLTENDAKGISSIAPTAEGDGFYVYDVYNSPQIRVYSPAAGLKKPVYSISLPVLPDQTIYHLISAVVSIRRSKAILTVYNLPEAGGSSELNIQTAGVFGEPVQFKFRLLGYDLKQPGQPLFNNVFTATSCKLGGDADHCWLINANVPEKYQFRISAFMVNTANGQLAPVEAVNKLSFNCNLLQFNVAPAGERYCWILKSPDIYRYDMSTGSISNFTVDENFHSSIHRTDLSKAGVFQIFESERKSSHYITVTDTSNNLLMADTRDFLADRLLLLSKDSLKAIRISNGRVEMRDFSLQPANSSSAYIFQQPQECDHQIHLSGTSFLLQSHGEGWQVFDMNTQTIVFQESYGSYQSPHFTDITGTNWLLLEKNNELMLYEKGTWNRPKQKLLLQHPLISEHDGLYASLLSVNGSVYNPSTGLLIVLCSKNSNWFVLAYDVMRQFDLAYVIKIPMSSITGEDKRSVYNTGLSVSDGLLLLFMGQLNVPGWKLAMTDSNRLMADLKKFISKIPQDYYKEEVVELHPNGGLLAGGILLNPYKGSAMVFEDFYKSRFPKATYIPLKGSIAQYHFSSLGNYVVITSMEAVTFYNIVSGKITVHSLPEEDGYKPTLNGRDYFFVESEGIITSNEEWRTSGSFKQIYRQPEYYSLDGASYTNNRLLLHRLNGKASQLDFNSMQMEQAAKATNISFPKLNSDSLKGTYFPSLGKWLLINQQIAGLDTAQKAKDFYVDRLLKSRLKEIRWYTVDTARNTVMLSDLRNTFEYWHLPSETCLFRLYILNEKDFFIETSNGYYYATPFALPAVCQVSGGRAIPSNLINAGLNRPDKVMEQVPGISRAVLDQFVKAYAPIARRQELSDVLKTDERSPVIRLVKPVVPVMAETRTSVQLQMESNNTLLNHASAFINNVKVWDTIFKMGRSARLQLPFELVEGENQLFFTCTDAEGRMATPLIQRIHCNPDKPVAAKTYVITIGVSQYRDSNFNLVYAAKDAGDILAGFRKVTPAATLVGDSLLDENVTRDNLFALKQRLMKTSTADKVIISFSGHGLLDTSRNFWFATWDMQFNDPSAKGFSFNEIESLLDGIPARRKLILLDACNSGIAGDVISDSTGGDKNVVTQYNSNDKTKGIILGNLPRRQTSDQIQYLFSAGSNQGGAEIIAATGGDAFAFESAQYNNGVFTYAFLQAIQSSNNADKDFNHRLSVRELKRYIYPMVTSLTNGRQKPIARSENPNYDWDVISEINSYAY